MHKHRLPSSRRNGEARPPQSSTKSPQLDPTLLSTRFAKQCIDVKPEVLQVVFGNEEGLRVFANSAIQIFRDSKKAESPRTLAVAIASQNKLPNMLLSAHDTRKNNLADRTNTAPDSMRVFARE